MQNVTELPEGKLPIDFLKPMLDSFERGNLVVSPSVGVDVGVTRSKGRFLVSSSDPITGTEKRIGWHGVNVSANDVATSGIMPDTLSMVAMFPPRTRTGVIIGVIEEIKKTAKGLGITVAGGHTEITPGLVKPIIVITCFGSGDKFVTAANAKPGDSILMTKTAGIEGTSILANLPKVARSVSSSAATRGGNLIRSLSIVNDAKHAFSTGHVHAMHDVTEGGVIGAVFEMGLASHLGFVLESDIIPVDPATREISDSLGIDPLRLIGSGALLIACSSKTESKVIHTLVSKGIRCTKIGRFFPLRRGRTLIRAGRQLVVTEESIQDELWPTLRKCRNA